MKKVVLIFLLAAAGCRSAPDRASAPAVPAPDTAVGAAAAAETPEPAALTDLSVADAVAVAVERNPDLGIASARILAANEEVREARSGWYPRVNLGLGYVVTNDPVLVFMQNLRQRRLSFGGDFNNPGWEDNFRLSASVQWLVWDGGRRQAGEDLAGFAVRMEEGAKDAVLNELKAAVIGTSLAVYEAGEFAKVARESVRLVDEQHRIAVNRFEAGAAQKSDVLSIEVRMAEAKEEVVRADNARERAMASLRNLMGLAAAEPFSLRPGGDFRVPPIAVDDLIATAKGNRPELRRAADAVAAASRGVGLARSDRNPTVSAFGSYDLDDGNGSFTLDQDSLTAGIAVDLNVFDGHRTGARIAAARARVSEAQQIARKTELMVENDVTRARLALSEARQRVLVSEKSEELAKEALELIRARYENGAVTITEYLDAEVRLTSARVRKVAARYDVERSTADLRRALGICRAGKGEVR